MFPTFIAANSRASSPALAALCSLWPVCPPRKDPAMPGCIVWIPNLTLRPVGSTLSLEKQISFRKAFAGLQLILGWNQHFSHTWSLSVPAAFEACYLGWAAPAGGDLGKGSFWLGIIWPGGEGDTLMGFFPQHLKARYLLTNYDRIFK